MSRRNVSSSPARGAGERTLGHDRILARPVPFALLTRSIHAKRNRPVTSGPRWCLKYTNPDRTKRVLRRTCRNENPTNRLAAGVGGRAGDAARQREGADPRPRRYGGRAPADAVDGRGEGLPLRGTQRTGEPGGPVRGPQTADRLPRLLRTGRRHLPGVRRRLPGAGLHRLLLRCRPGRTPGPPERADTNLL